MPDLGDRQRLGLAVKRARGKAGYKSMRGEWALVVGVSAKTLGLLEAGDPVGDRVIFAVEAALEWPEGWAHGILDGRYEGLPGAESDIRDRSTVTLAMATLDELLDEITIRRPTSPGR